MVSTVLFLGYLVTITSSRLIHDQLSQLKLDTNREHFQRKLRLLKNGRPMVEEKRSGEQPSFLHGKGLPVRVISEDESKAVLREEINDLQYEYMNLRKREFEYARKYKKPASPVEKQQELKKDLLRKLDIENDELIIKRELSRNLPVHKEEVGRPIEQIIYTKKDMKNPSESDSPSISELTRGRGFMKRKFNDLPTFRELEGKQLRNIIDDKSDDQEPQALPVEKQEKVLKKDIMTDINKENDEIMIKRELSRNLPVNKEEVGRPIEKIIYTKKRDTRLKDRYNNNKYDNLFYEESADDLAPNIKEDRKEIVEKSPVVKDRIIAHDAIKIDNDKSAATQRNDETVQSFHDENETEQKYMRNGENKKKRDFRAMQRGMEYVQDDQKEEVGRPIEQIIYTKKRDMRLKDRYNNNKYDNLFFKESADDLAPNIKEDRKEIVQELPVVKDRIIAHDAIKIDNDKSAATQRNDETVQSFHDENEREQKHLRNGENQKKRDFRAIQHAMGNVHFETRREFLARKDERGARKTNLRPVWQ